jgi:hypothetical protein
MIKSPVDLNEQELRETYVRNDCESRTALHNGGKMTPIHSQRYPDYEFRWEERTSADGSVVVQLDIRRFNDGHDEITVTYIRLGDDEYRIWRQLPSI